MNNDTLLKTPLHAWHVANGAKMASFADWDMPIQYSGILAEHAHTREAASIFDICHMGEILVSGPDLTKKMGEVVSANLATLAPGRCRYGFLLNKDGGIMDDLITYNLGEDRFMLVVNAACAAKDLAAVRERLPDDVSVKDISAGVGKIDLQGPASLEALEAVVPGNWRMPYFAFAQTEYLGEPMIISRTGYTGELGFELYVHAKHVEALWTALSAHPSVKPAGLGARDTLRLEAGLPLYGQDLDERHTPAEAGYASMLTSEAPYAGKEKAGNTREMLVALKIEGRRSARHGNPVLLPGTDTVVGVVTSGSFAPSLGYAVALAFIAEEHAGLEAYSIQADKTRLEGTRAALPFYDKGTARIKLT